MAKMPFYVDCQDKGAGPERLLRLSFQHPDLADLLQGRELELFVFTRGTVGDELAGRFHYNTAVLLTGSAGQVTVRTRWVGDDGYSRDYVVGLFPNDGRVFVIPPNVHYHLTTLTGFSSVLGFRAWLPGQKDLDEVQGYPPGYKDAEATPPDRR